MRTRLCDLFGIEYPIIQAGMGPFTAADLVVAVSRAGGLGSLGGASRPTADLREQVARIRAATDRPFAVNFLVSDMNEESFAAALDARVPILSLALGDPGEYVKRAHDAGALVMHQVHTVAQAAQAAERGVDVIIAQGEEAGGFGQYVAALPLIPQVVDAVRPLPVVAAGGIADGRGVAAALVLGAVGVNVGTRFLASVEAPIGDGWKQAIIAARSEDVVKVDVANDILPGPGTRGYGAVPRAVRTPFSDWWAERRTEAAERSAELRDEVFAALRSGRFHEYLPFAGQSAGLIHDVLPAGQIVRLLVEQAEAALHEAASAASR